MTTDLDLGKLSHAEKDALILSLVAQLQAALARIGELERRLAELQRPPKTPGNSSVPPSQGQKSNSADRGKRSGRRSGSVGRKGGGRELIADPDETVVARRRAANTASPRSPMPIRNSMPATIRSTCRACVR